MCWWGPKSADRHCDAIICDGAVRSGKTLCMGLSFVCWAMVSFNGQQFAFCGKSVVSLRRNLLQELMPVVRELGSNAGRSGARTFCSSAGADGKTGSTSWAARTRAARRSFRA